MGNRKLLCVHREAVKVSAGEESIALIAELVKDQWLDAATELNPFEGALLPDPDVADDQDGEEDQHLEEAKQAERLELDGPGEEKDRFDIKHHEKNSDNVKAHRISAACVVDGIDAALIGHQLGFIWIVGPDQFGREQRNRKQCSDNHDEDEDRDVVLRHSNVGYSTPS